MHYFALATDYDGTLATQARVSKSTLKALERFRESGRKLLLVTGRELKDLMEIFPECSTLFDRIVAENGALLYSPATKDERLLAPKAHKELVKKLENRKVNPLFVGRSIIATHEPHQKDALEAIQELGLEHQVIFNKGSVMILPPGINKGTGLQEALRELGLSPHNVVGVGDAENDHALLRYCECGVAVQNALESLKETADLVTNQDHSEGVVELMDWILKDDLSSFDKKIKRHWVNLGHDEEDKKVCISPRGACVLVAGPSGSGKTTVTTAILERLAGKGHQFCVVDPEGDYEKFPGTVHLGGPNQVPSENEVIELLEHFENPVVNLLGLPLKDRPVFFSRLVGMIQELRVRTGHPHWMVLDEAHHLLPKRWNPVALTLPTTFDGILMVTVHPDEVSHATLEKVNVLLAVGPRPDETVERFCKAVKTKAPGVPKQGKEKLHVVAWFRDQKKEPFHLYLAPGKIEHDRHLRKYAHGDMEEDAFYFRGPEGKLNIRAQNLALFVQIGDGVDDETWDYHLRRGDYSAWILRAVQDKTLAHRIERIEGAKNMPPEESRRAVREAIEAAYTAAA